MYTFDEILASGYWVFRDGLTTMIVGKFIANLKMLGMPLGELKIKELERIIFLENGSCYHLRDGFKMTDIIEYVDENLVLMFEELKKSRDEYYTSLTSRHKVKKIGER